MRKGLIGALLCVVAFSACSTEVTTNYEGTNHPSDKNPRVLQKIKFDHQFNRQAKCPNLGSNCGRKVGTAAIASELANFDMAIASGPSAIAAYFSNTTGSWRIPFTDLDIEEPQTYAYLTSGAYNVTKSMNGSDVIYFMGPASGTVDESNFDKAAYFEF